MDADVGGDVTRWWLVVMPVMVRLGNQAIRCWSGA